MAVVKYNRAMRDIFKGDLDFDVDVLHVLLLESATDLDPDDADVATVLARAGTTEATHTGYSRQTPASPTVSQDDTNDQAEVDAADITFSSIANDGGGTLKGMLVFKFVTNDAGSTPIAFIDTGGFPITPSGIDITCAWDADGIFQLT